MTRWWVELTGDDGTKIEGWLHPDQIPVVDVNSSDYIVRFNTDE